MTDIQILPETWVVIDALWGRLLAGTLPPEDIPAPLSRTDTSTLLDQLETVLYARPVEMGGTGATGDSLDALRAQWAGFKLVRFICRDNGKWILPTLERAGCGPEMAVSPRDFRIKTAFEALQQASALVPAVDRPVQ